MKYVKFGNIYNYILMQNIQK
ncbi:hypothetical protein, partial [Plasmodium yoelii yoelii]